MLGPCRFPSPLRRIGGFDAPFKTAADRILYHSHLLEDGRDVSTPSYEEAGPRFIACYAALAGSNVDFVLIPEVPFELDGDCGLLESLRHRLMKRGSAVIIVAEGAGQHMLQSNGTTDASGNRRHGDIGQFLKERITSFFSQRRTELNLKYIDPSYIVRSVPANAQDSVYCSRLAQAAVHAAMAGMTGMLVGRWHGSFVHLPLALVIEGRRKVDPRQELWRSVLECAGQSSLSR